MNEYISREAVVRYLKWFSEKELNSSSYGMITSSVLNKAERAISEMPAADVQPVNGWIAVKDRLPDEIGKVLVIDNGKVDINSWAGKYEGWYYANKNITHWMPLPELPKEKNNE